MKKIKEYIDKELEVYKNKKTKSLIHKKSRKINYEKELLISEYNIWIKNLYISMHMSKFRQVLTEIETNKKKYIKIPEEHWRYKAVQIKAIFHIIQKKLKKYKLILSKDNCYQNRSILFWFNQTVLILEQLNLEFRFDLNNNNDNNFNSDINSEIIQVIMPLQCIYQGYIELLYLLIRYSYIRGEFLEILAYLSIVDGLANYSLYVVNINSMPILQKIFLIRAKIYLANCDYLNATKFIKKTIDLCIEQLIYLVDYRLNLEIVDKTRKDILDYSLTMSKYKVKTLQNVLINIILDFYLRGVLSELIGRTTGAIDSYKQSKFFATKFLKNKFFNFTMFFYHLQNNGFKYLAVMEECQQHKEDQEINAKLNNRLIQKKNLLKRLKYQRNYNKYYSKIRVNHNLYKGALKTFLDTVNAKTFKEEENRQGILAKFRKAKFITSTIDLINILLSNDFKSSLKKMESIQISKYSKEVNDFINGNFYRKKKYLEEENNSFNMSKSPSKNKSKEMVMNDTSQITVNNLGFNPKRNSLTTKNSQTKFSKNYMDYSLYNFNDSKNNLNNKYALIFKNNGNLKLNNISNKSLLNEKKITNDSSYTTKKHKKRPNQSDISILNSLDYDNNLNNNFNANSTKNLFFKRNNHNDSSLILNRLSKTRKFSFIDTKSLSKNFSNFKKKFLMKEKPLSVKKLFKIKLNPNRSKRNKSKEHKKSQSKDEFQIDKDCFDKALRMKKNYIDKFCREEMKFHRKLLKIKSVEIEPYKEQHFDFDSKNAQMEAEISYNRIFELCKSSIGKKSFDSFFKNVKMVQGGVNKEEKKDKFEHKNSQEYNSGNETFDMNNLYVDNNWSNMGKSYVLKNNENTIKSLDMDYALLLDKENKLILKKKKL